MGFIRDANSRAPLHAAVDQVWSGTGFKPNLLETLKHGIVVALDRSGPNQVVQNQKGVGYERRNTEPADKGRPSRFGQ